MKKIFYISLGLLLCFSMLSPAQVFSPIVTSNYSLDAVAEFTPSTISTGGAIDGSNFVMYSVAYGTLFPGATGLPNNGLIASGTRTYQLQPYSGFNTLFILAGQTDSLLFPTPASYAALSVLGFATEGTGSMNVTIRFTDNSTAVFPSITLPDWFAASPAIIAGFDRCNRTTGTPGLSVGQPKMFSTDYLLNCLQRTKSVRSIKFQNIGVNPRLCIMAVSGAPMPTFSASTLPVTCVGGTNGSASISANGGLAPYSYTVSGNPQQFSANPLNLSVGIYTYTAQDAAGCAVNSTFAITQSLVPQPPISITSNIYTVCAGGSSFLGASGANTYTWSTGSTLSIISVTPNATNTYTVAGHTIDNCFRTGSLTIAVNPLPVVSFSPVAATFCVVDPCVNLNASPAGGVFTGSGVVSNSFCPTNVAPGSYTLAYTYVAPNTCSNTVTVSLVVNPLPSVSFSFNPQVYCLNAPTVNLNGVPAGGVYNGQGINGSVFSPSLAGVGTSSVVYSYTDANGCSASMVSTATINALPSLTFSIAKTFYCVNATNVLLNASPTGGIFSGTGVNAGVFSPSNAGAGVHAISYSYTNTNSCSTVKTLTVNVNACAGIDHMEQGYSLGLSIYPNPNNGNFTIRSESAMEVILYNQLGKKMNFYFLDRNNDFKVNVEHLSEGIYYFVVTNGLIKGATKVIVTKQ